MDNDDDEATRLRFLFPGMTLTVSYAVLHLRRLSRHLRHDMTRTASRSALMPYMGALTLQSSPRAAQGSQRVMFLPSALGDGWTYQ